MTAWRPLSIMSKRIKTTKWCYEITTNLISVNKFLIKDNKTYYLKVWHSLEELFSIEDRFATSIVIE